MDMSKQESAFMKRARKALFRLGWNHPFFAIPMGRVKLIEDTSPECPTAYVTTRGRIHLNPEFCDKLSDAELQGVVAHEICHPLFGHHTRRGERDARIFNIATDIAINEGLRASNIKLPAVAIYASTFPFGSPAWIQWNAERIYDALVQNADSLPQAGQGKPAPGAGCGTEPEPGEGDQEGEAGEGSSDGAGDDGADWAKGKSDGELEREWRQVAIQAATMARQRGDQAGNALANLTEIPRPKVRWGNVVRHGAEMAHAAAGRDSNTWSRRGRRSGAVGPQFPGWLKNAAKLAIVIDTSGSVDDQMLAQGIAETLAALRESDLKAYLVTHDHAVQWQGWVDGKTRAATITAACKGRGGTSAHAAYKAVEAVRGRFDVLIHLTDCELSWPAWPVNTRKRVIARVSHGGSVGDAPSGCRVIDVQV
jgi:predicted metal-dependent peptidase